MDIIVVTGASSGMGREFALQICKKEKADELWVIARRFDRLQELAEAVPIKIRPIELDLTDFDAIKKYADLLEEYKPNIKILANCAGFGKFEHYENIDTKVHLNMVDLNCNAPMIMTDYSLPYMQEGSKIMNIASCAAFQPIPYINIYAATKAFTLSYSRALNKELKYRGIHVLAVCPYWVKTEFFDRAVVSEENPVVINYDVLYEAKDVIKLAIKDLYTNKDMSVYGVKNRLQWFATKLLPHKFVMRVWLNRQKLDGTKEKRKSRKK
ncbi:MAG: SDR family NAD(P)-dependent oxidoreductase [Clostridiales bacterium]|nr:SDR family NAD(P)-dependent oxidoreductase [Clostridiales bacterium]